MLSFEREITGCTSERIYLFQIKKGRTIEELVQKIEKQSYNIAPFYYFNEYEDDNRPIIVLNRYESGFNYVGYTGRESKEYLLLKTPLLKEIDEKGITLLHRDFSKYNFIL